MNTRTLLRFRWLRALIADSVHRQSTFEQTQKRYPSSIISPECRVGHAVKLGKGTSLRAGVAVAGDVTIGRASFVNGPSVIRSGPSKIKIGSFCSIAGGLTILAVDHPIETPSTYQTNLGDFGPIFRGDASSTEEISIGSDVWIGRNCTILKGVSIGDGAIIAAGAVVVKDVEPYSIVGGVPAKIIKHRFAENIREWLLKTKWWDWPDEQVTANERFFRTVLSDLSIDEIEALVKN